MELTVVNRIHPGSCMYFWVWILKCQIPALLNLSFPTGPYSLLCNISRHVCILAHLLLMHLSRSFSLGHTAPPGAQAARCGVGR